MSCKKIWSLLFQQIPRNLFISPITVVIVIFTADYNVYVHMRDTYRYCLVLMSHNTVERAFPRILSNFTDVCGHFTEPELKYCSSESALKCFRVNPHSPAMECG